MLFLFCQIFKCILSTFFIDCFIHLKGQEGKLNNVIEELTDIPLMDNDSATIGTSLVAKDESTSISNDESLVSKEPPMSLQEKVENFMKYGQLDAVEGKLDNLF